VVLSHGFTGTPASMRPWGQYLADAGCTVRVPRLPGHGTRWQDANRSTWRDWYATVEQAFTELQARCEHVFAGGLSMGGTLVTRLAEEKGDALSGVVLVNPAYSTERFDARFARFVWPLMPSRPGIGGDIKKPGETEPGYERTPVRAFASLQQLWGVVRPELGRISAPVLLYRSREDHVVAPSSARILLEGATHTSIREVILEDSYHVATMDNDAPLIFEGSWEFMREIAGIGATAGEAERA
jgi:carboxylesterase